MSVYHGNFRRALSRRGDSFSPPAKEIISFFVGVFRKFFFSRFLAPQKKRQKRDDLINAFSNSINFYELDNSSGRRGAVMLLFSLRTRLSREFIVPIKHQNFEFNFSRWRWKRWKIELKSIKVAIDLKITLWNAKLFVTSLQWCLPLTNWLALNYHQKAIKPKAKYHFENPSHLLQPEQINS